MIAETSIQAYHEILADGTATTQHDRIYQLVKRVGPLTRRQISKITGIEYSTVGARCNKLVNEVPPKLIEQDTVECEFTGKEVKLLQLPPSKPTQEALF